MVFGEYSYVLDLDSDLTNDYYNGYTLEHYNVVESLDDFSNDYYMSLTPVDDYTNSQRQGLENDNENSNKRQLNMSSPRGNGNPIPPLGGGGMNGTPSPGGGGNDSSLIVPGNTSNNNDEDNLQFHQPRSEILTIPEAPFTRVDGGYVTGRDRVFIGDNDKYRVPVKYMENIYDVRGLRKFRIFDPDKGLLAGSNNGYGIGRFIFNNYYHHYGFIIPRYPSFESMPGPGIIIGEDPYTSIRANFRFPYLIYNPEISKVGPSGVSTYVELGIQYKFYYIDPRNLYNCELTYPNGFQHKIVNLKELSDFILTHRSIVLECTKDIRDQINIMSSPYYLTTIPSLDRWINSHLVNTTSTPDYMCEVYPDMVAQFAHLRRYLPPSSPSSSSSASF